MRQYNDREWRTMVFSPLWVFSAVAGIDDDFDEAEWSVLRGELEAAQTYENDLSRAVFSGLAEDFDDLIADFDEDEIRIGEGLSEVVALLAAEEDEEMTFGFKADLIIFAVKVAQASGGWLFGDAMSADERDTISAIADIFDLSEKDLRFIAASIQAKE